MQDPNSGKYHKIYSKEFLLAANILQEIPDGKISWLDADYQAFKFSCKDICLIFYPHKTSAGNYHIRVRSENSKNNQIALELMRKLYDESGPNCTFSYKTLPKKGR